MKKFLLALILILFAAVIAGGTYLWINRVELLSEYLSNSLQMRVTFADLKYDGSTLTFDQLSVQRTQEGMNFTAKNLAITFSWWEIMQKNPTIQKIAIQNGALRLSFNQDLLSLGKGVQNIFKNLPLFNSKQAEIKASSKSDKKVTIKHLIATNFRLEVSNAALLRRELAFAPVPVIELRNINTTTSSLIRGATDATLQALITRVAQSANKESPSKEQKK